MSESEWTVVTQKSKRRVARPKKQSPHVKGSGDLLRISHDFSWKEETKEKCLKQISTCVEQLQATSFHENLVSALRKTRNERFGNASIGELVCYGIGNFSVSHSASMWQLACVLCLRSILESMNRESSAGETSGTKILFFDPCITPMETHILRQDLNLNILATNERGKRRVQETSRCLFYMPHCPRPMYEKLLWANWDCLERVILIGNSVCAYDERITNDETESGIPLIVPFVDECLLALSKQEKIDLPGNVEGAFNDCYLSHFIIDAKESSLPPRPREYVMQASDEML